MSLRLSWAFLAVETCSKALLALCRGYGKSPCFLEVTFLRLLGVDAKADLEFADKLQTQDKD
jgi:hypothetical protein